MSNRILKDEQERFQKSSEVRHQCEPTVRHDQRREEVACLLLERTQDGELLQEEDGSHQPQSVSLQVEVVSVTCFNLPQNP